MLTSAVFVGRERELAELLGGLDQAMTGRGRLFLLGGEPGIGKSALAEELARHARERGARVLSGRCWEAGGAPPYWPWVQSIRALLEELGDDARRLLTGPFASDMAQMLPELGAGTAMGAMPPSADPDAARFRLFDATAGFLRNAARDDSLVITLEDLHAADVPSLLLLEFIARTLGNTRVLIVATYRDVEVGRDHPLASTVPELARETATRRITLTGLHPSDVERFIEQSVGVRPTTRLVDVVHRETEGNPLFVGEIVRLLASEGRLTDDIEAAMKPIPQGIRDVIARRAGHISERCNHVLEIASVLGREFTLDVLSELSERPVDELLEILDEARSARLVSETPGMLGGMRFSHSLIRDTMYEEMSASRRMRLHRRTAELLERVRKENPEHLAEIAHHFLAAVPAGETVKAVRYAKAAAEHALRRLAFEESARLFEMALQAMRLGDQQDETSRLELLLALSDALIRAGDALSAKEHAYEAAAIARRGDADALGRAALLYGGSFSWATMRGDARFVPLLEEALEAVTAAGTNPSMRVMLMAKIAAGPWRDMPDAEPRLKRSAEALELARALGDPATIAYAVEARMGAVFGSVAFDELLVLCDELERLAVAVHDGEKILMSHVWRMMVQQIYGNIPAVFAERQDVARLAQQLRQGPQNWFLRCTDASLAIFAGRFAEAEELAVHAYESGRRAEPYALFAYRIQMLWMRMEQGRQTELATEFADSCEQFTVYPVWRAIVPYLLLTYGTEEAARSAFRETFPAPRPVNEEYLLGLGVLADAAATLGERDAAAALYDELLPHAKLTMGGIPDINIGSTSRMLGRLAHLLGRLDEAERHFVDAIESNDRMGARPWAAWTRYWYARLLIERGDRDRAATLLADARAAALELGMAKVESQIEALEGTRTAVPGARSAPVAGEAMFLKEGEYWTIDFDGDSFRVRDSKGLVYLARLLSAPGREIHALDLVSGVSERGPNAVGSEASSVAFGDAGALLDPEAKEAYRARLRDLREEVEEARSWGNDERASRAEGEIQAITDQLAAAVGLGGRDRRAASAAERARINVTRSIRSVIGRLRDHSTALADYLEATVRTGTYCSYVPDPRAPLVWRL